MVYLNANNLLPEVGGEQGVDEFLDTPVQDTAPVKTTPTVTPAAPVQTAPVTSVPVEGGGGGGGSAAYGVGSPWDKYLQQELEDPNAAYRRYLASAIPGFRNVAPITQRAALAPAGNRFAQFLLSLASPGYTPGGQGDTFAGFLQGGQAPSLAGARAALGNLADIFASVGDRQSPQDLALQNLFAPEEQQRAALMQPYVLSGASPWLTRALQRGIGNAFEQFVAENPEYMGNLFGAARRFNWGF